MDLRQHEPPPFPPVLVQGLTKDFGAKRAVNDLSLQVNSGEIYALVGPDGAGKTTTMRLLCGALRPDAGRIRLAGIDVLHNTERARAKLGYMPQGFSLYQELTVLENLRFFVEVRGLPTADWEGRSWEILGFVGLEEFMHRRAGNLSGGMKKKLALATALVHSPPILLLDEPTGGVDVVTRQAFWQLLLRLLEQGVSVLLSTPYMEEAARCQRVGFIDEGRLLMEGAPEEITKALKGRVIQVRGDGLSGVSALAKGVPHVESVRKFGDRIHLRVEEGRGRRVISSLRRALKAEGLKGTVVETVDASLEDVFIALLEGQAGGGRPSDDLRSVTGRRRDGNG